jgi:hypothetical protein
MVNIDARYKPRRHFKLLSSLLLKVLVYVDICNAYSSRCRRQLVKPRLYIYILPLLSYLSYLIATAMLPLYAIKSRTTVLAGKASFSNLPSLKSF